MSDQLSQLRDLQTKLQQDISTKRTVIDSLSAQMASLAHFQTEQRSKYKEAQDAFNLLSDTVAKLK